MLTLVAFVLLASICCIAAFTVIAAAATSGTGLSPDLEEHPLPWESTPSQVDEQPAAGLLSN